MSIKEAARSAFVLRHSGLLDFKRVSVIRGPGEYSDNETRDKWEDFWAGVQFAITEQAELERVLTTDDIGE